MQTFLEWFGSDKQIDQVLTAGVAHFWFVTIHLFADGKRRIAPSTARDGFTACPRKSRRNIRTTTACWSARRRAPSM